MMLDLKSERSIPIHSCTEMTVKNLALLFPIAAKDASRASQDDVEDSTGKEAHENTAVSAQTFYEDSGQMWISRGRRGWGDIAKRCASDLSDLTMKRLRSPNYVKPSLQLYHLWRTLQWGLDDIEAFLPQSQSNLPAMILEVIEKFNLPYAPDRYAALQKTALVQFKTSQKLFTVEEQLEDSWIRDLSLTALNEQVGALMGLIRAKIKAEQWIDTAAQKGQIQESQEPHRHLLPFVMWRVQRASVENIVRLFLESKPSITDSILNGARKLNIRESVSRNSLKNMAQNATDPSYQLKLLEPTSQVAKNLDIQLKAAKEKSVIDTKKQPAHSSKSHQVVRSSPLEPRTSVSKRVDPHELVRQDRCSPRDSLRKMSRTRRKDFSHVGLTRKT
jgi:hypothetical protein